MKQGWEIKKLGEICEITNGFAFKSKEYTSEGHFVIRIGNVQQGYIELNNPRYIQISDDKQKKFILSNGDILVSLTGNVGRVGIIKDEHLPAVLNQRVAKISLKKVQICLNEYFFYFLNNQIFIDELAKKGRGAAQQNISTTDIEEIFFPLPPLPEQQRIVSILDKAFAAIDKAKANAEQNVFNANEFFENSAQGIFTQKGLDWEEKLLGDFAEFRNGINYTKGSKGEKIKIVGVKDFQDSYWVPENDLVEVSLDGKINETDLLREGDILAVRSNGNPQLIGRTLLAGIINEKVSHSGFTIRIRLNSKIVNPNYLCHFMKIQKTRKTLVESGNGVGIRSLNQGSLSSLKIPFPKSLKEQEMIIDKVDSIAEQSQKLKDIYLRKLNGLEELKKSILQKAFAGKLETETLETA